MFFKKCNISKEAIFCSPRHSLAFCLSENNADMRYVQQLLGYANIRMIQIYTKATNPFFKRVKAF
jgi:site-specific recombinase XerD